jgi:hypothetical protein
VAFGRRLGIVAVAMELTSTDGAFFSCSQIHSAITPSPA